MPVEIAVPPLAADEIHVWAVSTEAAPEIAEALVPVLSAHEQHRAARMRQPGDRRAFIVGRARVRQILGAYIGRDGSTLDIVARVDDKPVLAGAPAWFDFSFSRCTGLHVCAVGRGRRIGIDVEAEGDGRDAEAIARTFFSARETAWLAGRPPDERAPVFAGLWTRKEAFVKAVGAGLALPLTAFEVPCRGDGAIALAADAPPPLAGGRRLNAEGYFVRAFTPAPGVIGAVAAEGAWRLTLLRHPR